MAQLTITHTDTADRAAHLEKRLIRKTQQLCNKSHRYWQRQYLLSYFQFIVYVLFIVNIFMLACSQAAQLSTQPQQQQSQTSANQRERSSSFQSNNNNRNNNNELPPNFTEIDFPVNFTEAEDIDFAGKNATGVAPKPILNVAVRQNGIIVDSAIEVQPGTPLEMIIYLDEASSKVYGLTASYLKVTDNTPRNRSEVIVMNGCSIDNYLFGQFELNEEDKSLRAKFRAFKFPDSNHLLFVGTVNVCIKQCPKIDCGYGQVGYGRRRKRSTNDVTNNLFSLDMTTMIRMSNSHPPHRHTATS